MSESVLSKWQSGERNPSFTSAITIANFFDVPADSLAREDFDELLAGPVGDPERFRRVEAEIERLKREWEGKPEKAVPVQKRRRRKETR